VTLNAETPLTDLPLTPLKSALPGDVLAIIISGDGGWRDLDQQIGFELAKGNISVVGVDSLHYFWQAKSPQSIADDLTRIADHFSALWNTRHLLLIGYSFGADIMPAAVVHMSPAMRARIDQISLLGMSDTADYEIHVTGWIGIQPKGEPVAPDARKLDMSRVQCFYGTEEENSFCRSPVMQAAERFGIAGGHHFDGNYPHLAALIEAGLDKRLAAASAASTVSHPEQ
jgi:type IV secretory pathway VirJ component